MNAWNQTKDPPGKLLELLGGLERSGADRTERALVAYEKRDPAELAEIFSTTIEEGKRMLSLLEEPTHAQLEADMQRWSSSTMMRVAPRKLRVLGPLLASVSAGAAALIASMFFTRSLEPAEVVGSFDEFRGDRDVPSTTRRRGDVVSMRAKPSGDRSDLNKVVVLFAHGEAIHAVEATLEEDQSKTVEIKARIPAELYRQPCEWDVWVAHARRASDLPPRSEIARRLRDVPREGKWRLVHVPQLLKVKCVAE